MVANITETEPARHYVSSVKVHDTTHKAALPKTEPVSNQASKPSCKFTKQVEARETLKNTMGREMQKNPNTGNSTGPNAWLFHKTNCKN